MALSSTLSPIKVSTPPPALMRGKRRSGRAAGLPPRPVTDRNVHGEVDTSKSKPVKPEVPTDGREEIWFRPAEAAAVSKGWGPNSACEWVFSLKIYIVTSNICVFRLFLGCRLQKRDSAGHAGKARSDLRGRATESFPCWKPGNNHSSATTWQWGSSLGQRHALLLHGHPSSRRLRAS